VRYAAASARPGGKEQKGPRGIKKRKALVSAREEGTKKPKRTLSGGKVQRERNAFSSGGLTCVWQEGVGLLQKMRREIILVQKTATGPLSQAPKERAARKRFKGRKKSS